jgi:membrane-associated phospholipid phosphatase
MLGVHAIEDVIVGSIIGIIIGIIVQKANENYQKEIKEIISEIK